MIARLRNNEPLVVEKQFGKGRVVAQLTKLSSGDTPLGRWTNWSLNPAFPVLANELVSYLAATRQDRSAASKSATIWSCRSRKESTSRRSVSCCRATGSERGAAKCRSTRRRRTAG